MVPMSNKEKQTTNQSRAYFKKAISPMLVPTCDNETKEQNKDRWNKFFALSQEVRDRLADGTAEKVIEKLHERYIKDINKTAYLARAVRLYYFGELPLEKFADYFIQNIGVTPMVAQRIARVLATQIIKKPVKETKERMTLRSALDRFDTLKDQVITQQSLIVAGSQRRSPGTIENWLTDYHLAIGQGRHTAIERGNYLFHNRNTKELSAAERQRVAMVLKSFDEDMAMIVDTQRGEVVFPEAQTVPHRKGVSQRPPRAPHPTMPQPHITRVQHNHKKDGILKAQQMQNGAQAAMRHARAGAQVTAQRTQDVRRSAAQPMGYINFSSGQKLPREKTQEQ